VLAFARQFPGLRREEKRLTSHSSTFFSATRPGERETMRGGDTPGGECVVYSRRYVFDVGFWGFLDVSFLV